jgi:hypothetical protein
MYKYLFLFVLLSNSASAETKVFYSYSSWIRLPMEARIGYLMGAFDTLIVVADESEKIQKCMLQAKMTGKQLAKNVQDYAATRPQFYGGAVQAALIDYLKELCSQSG